MLTEQHREEQLSRAYVQAVAAHAGIIFDPATIDYGVDGTLRRVIESNGRRLPDGFTLDIQLKATINWSIKGDYVIYDLKAKTFNDLVDRYNEPRATPLVLVVLCLPENENDWLYVSHEQLILRRCCYWCRVGSERTANTETHRIEIPLRNILDCTTVLTLLNKIAKGERLE